MKRVILTNAFSLNMLPKDLEVDQDLSINFLRTDANSVSVNIENAVKNGEKLGYRFINAVGHADTDRVIKNLLGIDYEDGQRLNITLTKDVFIIVAQYIGPRLQEGATSLPDDAEIRFFYVTDHNDNSFD